MGKIRKINKKTSKSKTRKAKKPMNSFTFLLILIGLVYVAFCFINLNNKSSALKNQINKVNNNIEQEQIVAEELAQREELINSEEYIEEKAREMGMIMPNEKVYIDITK